MQYDQSPALTDVDAESFVRFSDFNLPAELARALDEMGLETPTPIQKMAIPLLCDGQDLVGLAQTGTGKTAAFLLPLITHLMGYEPVGKGESPRALILAPTRELAQQVLEQVRTLTNGIRLRSLAVFGGARYDGQINGLKRGADIVVATPGRLEDLIKRRAVSLEAIRYFILDEADHMLDLGFYPAIQRISEQIAQDRQTMLFSATMPDEIRKLAQKFLDNPVHIKAPDSHNNAKNITQKLYLIEENQKREKLADMLADGDVTSSVIFVRTKRKADALSDNLSRLGYKVDALHGDMKQFIRRKVLAKFKEGKLTALIATDVAARGIDIPALSHVFNFDLPEGHESYVHRIGRTGRAGKSGIAVSFCSASEKDKIRLIISRSKTKVTVYDADGEEIDHDELPAGRSGRNRRPFQRNRPHRSDRKKDFQRSRKSGPKPARRASGNAEQDELLDEVKPSQPRRKQTERTPHKNKGRAGHPGSKNRGGGTASEPRSSKPASGKPSKPKRQGRPVKQRQMKTNNGPSRKPHNRRKGKSASAAA